MMKGMKKGPPAWQKPAGAAGLPKMGRGNVVSLPQGPGKPAKSNQARGSWQRDRKSASLLRKAYDRWRRGKERVARFSRRWGLFRPRSRWELEYRNFWFFLAAVLAVFACRLILWAACDLCAVCPVSP